MYNSSMMLHLHVTCGELGNWGNVYADTGTFTTEH